MYNPLFSIDDDYGVAIRRILLIKATNDDRRQEEDVAVLSPVPRHERQTFQHVCKEDDLNVEVRAHIKTLPEEERWLWQKCYACRSWIEKTEACNHTTCRCNAQFSTSSPPQTPKACTTSPTPPQGSSLTNEDAGRGGAPYCRWRRRILLPNAGANKGHGI